MMEKGTGGWGKDKVVWERERRGESKSEARSHAQVGRLERDWFGVFLPLFCLF